MRILCLISYWSSCKALLLEFRVNLLIAFPERRSRFFSKGDRIVERAEVIAFQMEEPIEAKNRGWTIAATVYWENRSSLFEGTEWAVRGGWMRPKHFGARRLWVLTVKVRIFNWMRAWCESQLCSSNTWCKLLGCDSLQLSVLFGAPSALDALMLLQPETPGCHP